MAHVPQLLLVDDQEANLLLLSELVESLGLNSIQARDGLQALSMAAEKSPDLILLDIMMPIMDGQQALEALMNNQQLKNIPVIMISAMDEMERVAWCIAKGATDYLVKPFNFTLLKARIYSCLEKKRLFDSDQQQRKDLELAHLQIARQNEVLFGNNRNLELEIKRRVSVEKDLRMAQRIALRNAHAMGMAELARSVLHNIGNTLNSVNISCNQLQEIVDHSWAQKLVMANTILKKTMEGVGLQSQSDSLLTYYTTVAENLCHENDRFRQELGFLCERVEQINEIIGAQRSLSTGVVFTEILDLTRVIDDVLSLQRETLLASGIIVVQKIVKVSPICGQKIKLCHALLNLIINARESMEQMEPSERVLTLELGEDPREPEHEVFLRIIDSGEGIPEDSLKRIFNHGFTTREGAGGFGLHATAIAMNEMDGRIEVSSEGLGKGACFTLYFRKSTEPFDRLGFSLGDHVSKPPGQEPTP